MSPVEEKPSQKGRDTEVAVQLTAALTIEDEEDFPDGGLRAWLVVIGCFVVNTVTVGFWWVIPLHAPHSQLTHLVSSFVSVILA